MIRAVIIFLILFSSCERSIEFETEYWCETFSRVRDRYTYEQDTTGTITNFAHAHDTIPNVELCGYPDIEQAHCCPFIKVLKHIPDSSSMTVFVDSTVIFLMQII